MSNPKVSLIICIYNMEKYLRCCLDNVISQTLSELEIICINDGSTDNSLSVVREYAQNDSRFVVIDKPNTGYADSLNMGIDRASGEYLTVLDPDDYPSVNMYKTLYEKAVEIDADFVKADYTMFNDSGIMGIGNVVYQPDFYNRVITEFTNIAVSSDVATWAGIYKTDFIKKHNIRHRIVDGVSFPDQFFSFQIAVNAKKAYFINEPLYFYRKDRQGSAVNNSKFIFYVNDEYEEAEKYLCGLPDKKEFYKLLWYKKFLAYRWNLSRLDIISKIFFAVRMNREFNKADKEKKLDLSLFPGREKKELLRIMHPLSIDFTSYYYEYLSFLTRRKVMDFKKYFKENSAQKRIDRLAKKYKNKKVVIYGAGAFCRELFECCDLSRLNITAIADKAFENPSKKDFHGLLCLSPDELKNFDCDVILIGTYNMLQIYDYLRYALLFDTANSKAKIRPLIKKKLSTAFKELFS